MSHETNTAPESHHHSFADQARGLHPLFQGLECCPLQVTLADGSAEVIVVHRIADPIPHHRVKGRFGVHALNPSAEIQLVEILSSPE